MRSSRLWRTISQPRNVLEGSIKAQIKGLDVNFHISNEGVYTLDVELRYVVLKLRKKCCFFQLKQNVWRVMSWLRNVLEQSITAQIESLEVSFHNVSWKNCYFYLALRKKSLKIRKKSILLIREIFPTYI